MELNFRVLFSLWVSLNLPKVFDIVDHTILIRKFEMCSIKCINLAWFCSYLTNRMQFTSIIHDHQTDTKNICCGVSQSSLLGLLLFLLYANDLHNSPVLDPIMFSDDTSLFHEHKDLKTSFSVVNKELPKNTGWFEANKLSPNVGKTKYLLFHKPSRKGDLLLLLPRLLIKKHNVERVKSIKFFGRLLDENVSWKYHIKHIEY